MDVVDVEVNQVKKEVAVVLLADLRSEDDVR